MGRTLVERGRRFSIYEQLPRRKVKRFRGGLVSKAHRRVYHSRLESKKEEEKKAQEMARGGLGERRTPHGAHCETLTVQNGDSSTFMVTERRYRGTSLITINSSL